MKKTIGREVVEQALRDPKNAALPRKTLARILCNQNPELFNNAEHCRTIIRNVVGQNGDYQRKLLADKSLIDEPRSQRYAIDMIPESSAEDWKPYEIQKAARKVLLLSDLHLPYHSVEALHLAIDYGIRHEADSVILNGDTMDFHRASKYQPDPRARSLADELECGRQFLTMLRSAFPGAAIYWKDGNHDERLRNYLITKAPELLGVHEYELPVLLRFGEHGINYITDKRIIMVGKLPVIHGHEVMGGGSVNPARTLYMRAKASGLQGHNHRTSEHSEKDIHGDISTTWSTGCLSELTPRYMPINNWNHGFAFVELDADGNFEVRNKRILNGKVL